MRYTLFILTLGIAGPLAGQLAVAQNEAGSTQAVTATLELGQQFYYAGEPFLVRLTIGNRGSEVIDNPVKAPLLEAFRVRSKPGLSLEAEGKPTTQEPTRPKKLAPGTFYGAVLDLTEIFPGLGNVGEYEVSWSSDGIASQTLLVKMLPKYDPQKNYRATIETDMGRIVFRFLPKVSPIAVKAFIDMANAGFYDGLLMQEVRDGWYVAGGDPQFGDRPRTPFVFPAEQSAQPITAGAVVMKPVRSSPPANSSPFLIFARPAPSWTGQVTVLGQVIQGLEVVREISRVPSSLRSERPYFKPLNDVRIRKITVSAEPEAEAQAGETGQ